MTPLTETVNSNQDEEAKKHYNDRTLLTVRQLPCHFELKSQPEIFASHKPETSKQFVHINMIYKKNIYMKNNDKTHEKSRSRKIRTISILNWQNDTFPSQNDPLEQLIEFDS